MTFRRESLRFLEELARNNRREWFEEHKERYDREVREPAREFIRAMQPRLGKISKHLVADDRKVGGSLMRIHRDVRFSREKSPYKTNIGIQFRHAEGKDVHAPGFYVHVDPFQIFLGVGIWRPESSTLAAVRESIATRSKRWREVIDDPAFQGDWRQDGEVLRSAPRGFPKDHPLIEEIKRKDFTAVHELTARDVASERFADLAADKLRSATKFMKFLCEAVGLRF